MPRVLDVNPNPELGPGVGICRAAQEAGWTWEQFVAEADRVGARVSLTPATVSPGSTAGQPCPRIAGAAPCFSWARRWANFASCAAPVWSGEKLIVRLSAAVMVIPRQRPCTLVTSAHSIAVTRP